MIRSGFSWATRGAAVADVALVEAEAALGEVGALDAGIVVVVEVVDDGDVIAASDQAFEEVRADDPAPPVRRIFI